MKMLQHSADNVTHSENAVLTKALKKAAQYWQLNNKQLSAIIGLSEATISRLNNNRYEINLRSKEGELAVLFLRVFRGLDAYMGGHEHNQILWINAGNHVLGGKPVELMCTIQGLSNVVQYIDAIRGQ